MKHEREPMEHTTVRLPPSDLDRAEKILESARDWPEFHDRQPTLKALLRLAIQRGLKALELERCRAA
jgi:choline dehydrogenase-like flavoprotein